MNKYFTQERVDRITLEAEEKGYRVENMIDADTVQYTRLQCNHKMTASPSNMRHQKRTMCKECNELEFEALIKDKEVEIVERINTSTFKFRVNSCKHEITTSIHNIGKNRGPYKCSVCMDEEFLARCEEVNVDIIQNPINPVEVKGYHSPSKYAKFKYRDCGHDFFCIRHNILSMKKCATCANIAKTKTLSDYGYEIVGYTDTTKKKLFKFKSCGHERVFYESAALRGNAICHVCNITSTKLKSKLYIMQFETDLGFQFIKFGYGKNTKNRVREYVLRDTKFIDILFELEVETGEKARLIENTIHKELLEYKLPNDKMRVYLTKTGYSECYPVELLDEIKTRIQNKCSSDRENNGY